MTDPYPLRDDSDVVSMAQGETPRHGFRGHPRQPGLPGLPASLTVAISRETGARGSSISKRVGELLSWQVYTQELLEYIAQEGSFSKEIADHLAAPDLSWVDQQLELLLREENLSQNPAVLEIARIILGLGSQGDVVLLGRGAGNILPAASTLHVRLLAPLADRIAYTSQCLRLTEEEAATFVRQRDLGRAEFLTTHFHRGPDDVHQYDMLINTSLLGEEGCASLIAQAARAKQQAMSAAVDADAAPENAG